MDTTTAKHNQLKYRDVELIHLYHAIPKNIAKRRQKDCKEPKDQGVCCETVSPSDIKNIHTNMNNQDNMSPPEASNPNLRP